MNLTRSDLDEIYSFVPIADDALILRMKKNLLLFVLCLSLMSCGKKSNDSSSPSFTDEGGGLPQLNDGYTPSGLSDMVFVSSGNTQTPMNFLSQELVLTFDAAAQTVKGKSVIKFSVKKTGRPYFELQATPTSVKYEKSGIG